MGGIMGNPIFPRASDDSHGSGCGYCFVWSDSGGTGG